MAANKIAQANNNMIPAGKRQEDVHLKTAQECPHTFSRGKSKTSLHDTPLKQHSKTCDEGNGRDRPGEI